MTPRLQISGLTRLEDARYCAAMGADFLGFVQDPASPRYVPPGQAREIGEWVVGPEPVGIFGDATADEVVAACAAGGFRMARLDGMADPEACAAVEAAGIPVVKTFPVRHDASAEQLRALLAPYAGHARYVRLDTEATSLWGADGESVSWRLVAALRDEADVFLAGTVTPESLPEALRMRPVALDVSTTVEEAPGVLDFDRLGAFFDAFHAQTGA